MFPHTITIYRLMNDESYQMQIVNGVYWQEDMGVIPSQKGVEYNKSVTIITSPETTKKYGTWDVKERDRIIKGRGEQIGAFKELLNSYTVRSVVFNTAETSIDNIVIVGA